MKIAQPRRTVKLRCERDDGRFFVLNDVELGLTEAVHLLLVRER
jgi:hypothetical protein